MDAQKEDLSNRRRHDRATVLWKGQLVFREQVLACLIVNISSGGAMVRAEDASACPTTVTLRNERIGDLAAEIMWRKGDELGLRFVADQETIADIIGQALG